MTASRVATMTIFSMADCDIRRYGRLVCHITLGATQAMLRQYLGDPTDQYDARPSAVCMADLKRGDRHNVN